MNKARPLSLAVMAAVLASTTLSACAPIIVGGAVAGTLAASDRRTLGAQTEDKSIVVKAEVKMPNIAGKSAHVNVNSFNRRQNTANRTAATNNAKPKRDRYHQQTNAPVTTASPPYAVAASADTSAAE